MDYYMDYASMRDVFERHRQAREALKLIMHQERLGRIECAEFGTSRSMWVTYRGANGADYTRQFSWDTQYEDRRARQMQWIFDAYMDFHRLRERQQQTDYERRLPQLEEAIYGGYYGGYRG